MDKKQPFKIKTRKYSTCNYIYKTNIIYSEQGYSKWTNWIITKNW